MSNPCYLDLTNMYDLCYMGMANVSDPRYLGLTNMSGLYYCRLSWPPRSTYFGLDGLLSLGVLGLANILDPRYMDLAARQVQTSRVWHVYSKLGWLPSPHTLDLVGAKCKRLRYDKHVKPMLLWTWQTPSSDVLALANMTDPHYLGLTNIPDPINQSTLLGSGKHARPILADDVLPAQLEFRHCGGWKNRVLCFFTENPFSTYFWPKTPRDLVKPIHGHQEPNKPQKTWNPTKTKILPKVIYVFVGVFKDLVILPSPRTLELYVHQVQMPWVW